VILLRRRFAIALAFSLTIGSFCWASAPVDLDRETELTSRLEAFLTHRIQRVVNSSGVRGDDFSASAIVKVVKIAPPHAEEDPSAKKASDPEKAKKDAQKESEKKNENPDFLTFNDNSFMDADHLIAEVEREESSVRPTSLNLDKKPEPEKKDDDSYYGIDHVFIQAALSEKLDAATLTAVEKTLHNSFDPLFGNKVTIEVKPYTAVQPTWYETLFKWLKSFQWLTMELLFLTLATVLFFANKLIRSKLRIVSLRTKRLKTRRVMFPPILQSWKTFLSSLQVLRQATYSASKRTWSILRRSIPRKRRTPFPNGRRVRNPLRKLASTLSCFLEAASSWAR
jgi:hypothetical protein